MELVAALELPLSSQLGTTFPLAKKNSTFCRFEASYAEYAALSTVIICWKGLDVAID
jgi:hypothetical protein